MIRAVILSATIAALVTMWRDNPEPVKDNQAPYCLVDVLQAMRHPLTGEIMTGWGPMYRPCSEQDSYREI